MWPEFSLKEALLDNIFGRYIAMDRRIILGLLALVLPLSGCGGGGATGSPEASGENGSSNQNPAF